MPYPMHSAAELISMTLTPLLLVVSIAVIATYGSAARTTIRKWLSGLAVQKEDLLVLGVVVGFTGKFLDSLYWSVPWSLSFIGDPSSASWHQQGVYANVFSRQLCGIAAATLHLTAAALALQHSHWTPYRVLKLGLCLGVAFMLILLDLRWKNQL